MDATENHVNGQGDAIALRVIEAALDAVVTIDAVGLITGMNRAAEELFNLSREDAVGRDVAELIVPETFRDRHRTGLARAVATGEQHIIGRRIRTSAVRSDGSEFPIELAIVRLDGPAFAAFMRDTSEEESAEEVLRQSQRTLFTLLSNLPGMAYRCPENKYWTLAFASEGCKELTGHEPDDLVENPELSYQDLIHEDDRGRVWAHVQGALSERTPFQVTYRITTAAREEKWVLERGRGVSSVFSEAGDLLAIEGFITDITDQKRAEELLNNYSRTLEEEVAERTAQLNDKNADLEEALGELRRSQDQLVVQEKMASLGALTAGIAHEIKNPLNFVNNFAELSVDLAAELAEDIKRLEAGMDATTRAAVTETLKDLSENAVRIREHGKRADSIIRGMLMHSRGGKGERQRTNINALLEEDINLAYHGMRAQEPAFNVTIVKDFDASLPEIEVVPQDIGRVFLNLLNNACQAVNEKLRAKPAGFAPEIRVRTGRVDGAIVIRIRDNGPGIAPAVRERLFTPFFTTKPTGQGTGLGLSIAYDIVVQAHQGLIEVESEPGEYAEFIIRLPDEAEATHD